MELTVATPDRVFARHTGGNTTYARSLYAALPSEGVRHELLRVPSRWESSRGRIAWEAAFAARAATSRGAHIIHYPADTGAVLPSRRVGVVTTVHGVADRYNAGVRTSLSALLWRQRVKAAIRASDVILSVSHASADDVAEVFDIDRGQITVAHHGIDHEVFRPLSADEITHRLRGFADLPERFALFVGNIEPRKNVAAAFEAFATPDVQSLGVPLVAVGRPAWQSAPILERAAALPNNLFLGPISQEAVVALMNRALAFVFPTRYEGFGFPILEAMACGCPVVTTRAGAVPEVAGEAALFVETSVDSIAAGVAEVVTNSALREMLRARGLERAATYTWATSAAVHARVFRKLASDKGLLL